MSRRDFPHARLVRASAPNVTAQLSQEEYDQFTEIARAANKSRSSMMRDVVRALIDELGKDHD